jgi:flavodoxin
VPRILVVHHSKTGNTRRIAEEIAEGCDAEIEEIVARDPRAGAWGDLLDGLGAIAGVRPAIAPSLRRPADYDLVVIGTPVWSRSVCGPVRSYLHAHTGQLPAIALFCTSRWPGGASVLRDMAALCGRTPVATLALREHEIVWRQYGARLDEFLRLIGERQAEPLLAAHGVPA